MPFISMDLLGPYHKTEKGNQYALTVICLLKNYVFMILFRSTNTEEVMKAYLMDVYSIFRGSKYILSDRGAEYTSKQFTWLASELGFIKVYTLPYTPTGTSVIERTHAFLKAALRKLIFNQNIDWDEIVHVTTMAYNVFPHSSAVEAPLYLMFEHDALCQFYLNCYSQNSDTCMMKNVEFIWMPYEKST